MSETPLSTDNILPLIHTIRDVRVILASDLARLYGSESKKLNQAVKRNLGFREKAPRYGLKRR